MNLLMRITKKNKEIFITVLFLTFTVLVYAPLEVYLQNRGEFWFNFRLVWWIPTLIGLVSFLLFFSIGSILKPSKLKDLYAVMAFAGGLCAYIQGNFLNKGLGLMD